MRTLKTVIIIIIAAVIFLVVVAGVGSAGGNAALERMYGVFSAGADGGLYEMKNGGYIVGESNKYQFTDKMLADGWALISAKNGAYTFERNGHVVEYAEEPMSFGFVAYELTE